MKKWKEIRERKRREGRNKKGKNKEGKGGQEEDVNDDEKQVQTDTLQRIPIQSSIQPPQTCGKRQRFLGMTFPNSRSQHSRRLLEGDQCHGGFCRRGLALVTNAAIV